MSKHQDVPICCVPHMSKHQDVPSWSERLFLQRHGHLVNLNEIRLLCSYALQLQLVLNGHLQCDILSHLYGKLFISALTAVSNIQPLNHCHPHWTSSFITPAVSTHGSHGTYDTKGINKERGCIVALTRCESCLCGCTVCHKRRIGSDQALFGTGKILKSRLTICSVNWETCR